MKAARTQGCFYWDKNICSHFILSQDGERVQFFQNRWQAACTRIESMLEARLESNEMK